MRKNFHGLTALVAAFALTASLSSCASNVGDPDAQGDGVAGQLIWYSSHNPTQNEAVLEAFNEKYPDVDLQIMRLVTGELATRYAQERDSGQATADVVTLSDPAFVEEGASLGWWETDTKVADGWPDSALKDGVITTGSLPLLFAYNSDRISAEEAPDSWDDLADPKYAGKLMMPDVRNDPAYLSLVQIWSEEYGDDFIRDLARQKPQFVASVVPGNEALAAGSADILAPNAMPSATTMIDAGAPIVVVEPELTTGIEYYSTITTNAKNPEAAAAFYEFLSSKDGQEAFNGKVGASTREDAIGGVTMSSKYKPLMDVLPEATDRKAELLALLNLD